MNTNEHECGERKLDLSAYGGRRITEVIIGLAMKVHNQLGAGFLEKVYENALVFELRLAGFEVSQQRPIPVFYEGVMVGDYISDLVVENKILLELKAIAGLEKVHKSICLNYLKASQLPVCLLINFGRTRLEWDRLVGDRFAAEVDLL